MNQDWTPGFFTGLFAESLQIFSRLSPTAAEADFLEREMDLRPGTHVLDVPCGTGRLAEALAAKGMQLTGVDSSAVVLKEARKSSREIQWIERDMRELQGLGKFDAAFCFGNSFGYFDDDGNRQFLNSVASVLKPGGRFALETHFAAESLFPQKFGKRWYQFEDLLFLHDVHFDPASGILTSNYVLMKGGEVERRQARYRVFLYRELVRWMDEAGLKVRCAYGSLEREPFQLGCTGLWIIAERVKT